MGIVIRKTNKAMILVIVMFFTIISCSSSNDEEIGIPTPTYNTVKDVVNIVNTGTWKISYFYNINQDDTSLYTNYNFTFGPNKLLTATEGGSSYNGNWLVTDSNTATDNINELTFNIAYFTPTLLENISEDWKIIEKSSTVIKMKNTPLSGNNISFLTITKN